VVEQARPAAGVESVAKSVLDLITAVAGYTAVLSALMLYFGYIRTRTLFGYFGVPTGVLQFTTTDYLLRSPDVFFKPVIWTTLSLAILVAITLGAKLAEHKGPQRIRIIVRGLLALITALTGASGIWGLSRNPQWVQWAAIALGLSGALVVVQYRMYRVNQSFRPPLIVLLIGLLLTTAAAFWWVSIYAQTVGRQTAEGFTTGPSLPLAIVYSKDDLRMPGQEPQVPLGSPGQRPWPFKYCGYKVLSYANGRWFLIQDKWDPKSPTVILPDDESVRVEVLQAQ
jgi:hypothetical protein